MGSLWIARDETADRDVVVKLLSPKARRIRKLAARLLREAQAAASLQHPALTEVLDFGKTDDGDPYVVMERLQRMVHMDSADDVSGWSLDDIESALRGIAQIHAVWYGKEAELLEQNWLPDYPTAKRMEACSELWEALGVHAWDEFPRWFGKDDLKHHRLLVNSITDWWGEIEQLPRTLIHNDFNPRNLCLRPVGDGATRLCVYDWELATLGLPQHDVAEFLSFVLSDSVDEATVSHLVGVHRQALQEASGVTIPEDVSKLAWRRSLQDLVINRVPMYAMAHTFRHYGFMERLSRTLRHLLSLELGTLEPLAERSLV